jgi:DNA replication and repair protein RecF
VWLKRIEADRLRNLKAVTLDLPEGMTVVAGRNGQGKSSLLEAIYLLGTSRSFRTRTLAELTCWDDGPLRVAGRVEAASGVTDLAVIHDRAERSLLLDRLPKELDAYLGRLDVVDLTAEREQVLRGSPDERRRFLDRGLVGLYPSHLHVIAEYRRLVGHRNALLRRLGPGARGASLAELDAWDERLAESASRIHLERRKYALSLAARLGEAGRALFRDGEELVVHYQPSPRRASEDDPSRFRDRFLEALAAGRERDLGLGFTHSGPHRDDLAVELDGVDLRKFGSAGQQRAALVVLKLAKLTLLKDERGDAPVFLMDDYDTDLDEIRARSLAEVLHEGGFQAIVATSKEEMIDRLGVAVHRVHMLDGEVRT